MVNEKVAGPWVRSVGMIFPGDANHHGTLFGGVALARMDKIAFLAATLHGRATFVTASSERIDFAAPARVGEIVEAAGRVTRVGMRSLDVEVELHAEAPLSGEWRLCTRGMFTMVAEKGALPLAPLTSLSAVAEEGKERGVLRTVDMVFPPQTSHYGTLYGGDALKMMGGAAFLSATRRTRAVMVMAASDRIDFLSPIREGEMVELVSRVRMTGRSSVGVEVELWAETLLTADRRRAATALFTMVSVGPDGRPRPFDP